MEKYLEFDVMCKERFVCTIKMPITLDIIAGYDGDEPVFDWKKIAAYVEQKRPSLKYVDYKICF